MEKFSSRMYVWKKSVYETLILLPCDYLNITI